MDMTFMLNKKTGLQIFLLQVNKVQAYQLYLHRFQDQKKHYDKSMTSCITQPTEFLHNKSASSPLGPY